MTRKVLLTTVMTLMTGLLLLAPAVKAQTENIYLIKTFDCTHQPAQRSQTGFKVHGVKGIITALHGVADCRRVTASSRGGVILDQPLNLMKVDIDRDVALLSSPQINNSDTGLEVAKEVAWESLGAVKVKGHPYGIGDLETTLTARNPPLTKLRNLLPPSALAELIKRQSPSHLINVLSLQGNLLPGHSGAPILDSASRVLAVANGGLKEGFAGISWAVPFQDIEWNDPDARLSDLAQTDPNILFANIGEPAGTKSTSSKPLPIQTQEVDFFTFDIDQCVISGSSVACFFTIKNNAQDRRLGIDANRATLIDDTGNEASGYTVRLANDEGGDASREILQYASVKGWIRFNNVSPSAQRVARLRIRLNVGEYQWIDFRNVPLDKRIRDSISPLEIRESIPIERNRRGRNEDRPRQSDSDYGRPPFMF